MAKRTNVASDAPKIVAYLLFIGVRKAHGGGLLGKYIRVTPEDVQAANVPDDPDRVSCYVGGKGKKYKPLAWATPGAILQVEASDANASSIYPSTAKVIGRWPDDAKAAGWVAESEAIRIAHRAERESKRLAQYDSMLAQLEPFRRVYWMTHTTERAALMLKIINAIQSPRPYAAKRGGNMRDLMNILQGDIAGLEDSIGALAEVLPKPAPGSDGLRSSLDDADEDGEAKSGRRRRMTIFKTTIRIEGGIRIESYFVHCPSTANVEVAIDDFFTGISKHDNTLFGKRKRDALRLADSAARNAEPIEVRNN